MPPRAASSAVSACLASIDLLASIDSGQARERRQLSGAVNVLGRSVPVVVLVVVGAVGLALLHVLWLARVRWGQITDWDEGGDMAIALPYAEGLVSSPREFVEGATPPSAVSPPWRRSPQFPCCSYRARD